MSNLLYLNVHGVAVKIAVGDTKLAEFIHANFFHFVERGVDDLQPDIDVKITGYWNVQNAPVFSPPRSKASTILGNGLLWNRSRMYWESPRVRTSIAFSDHTLSVTGDYVERIDHTIRRKLLRKRSILYQNYQTLMRYTIHYPIFWLLESSRHIGLLHASAVEKDGKALIFTGLNGCGKSTLTTNLWRHQGYKLLSDNFLLHDENTLYGFPEVVRINTRITDPAMIEKSFPFPIYQKRQYVLSSRLISLHANPAAIFFTTIGEKTKITSIKPERMMTWLSRISRFLGEFTHNTYLEFFTPQDTPPNFSVDDWQTRTWLNLRRLIETTRCYELEIGYGQPADETVAKVLQVVNNQ